MFCLSINFMCVYVDVDLLCRVLIHILLCIDSFIIYKLT